MEITNLFLRREVDIRFAKYKRIFQPDFTKDTKSKNLHLNTLGFNKNHFLNQGRF